MCFDWIDLPVTIRISLDDIEKKDAQLAQQMYIFSTFFYPKLAKEGPESVRKWTSGVDLFDKKYIFVPINKESVGRITTTHDALLTFPIAPIGISH